MQDNKVHILVRTALMAAVCFVLTRVVTIPAPTGYVNIGDCGVLLSAWLLGPIYGGLAAGIGSMLADVLSGYAAYAPGTFIIKFAMAAVAALVFHALEGYGPIRAHAAGAVIAEVIMIFGYFGYNGVCLGVGLGAAASIPADTVQGAIGAIAGCVLIEALERGGLGRLRTAWDIRVPHDNQI